MKMLKLVLLAAAFLIVALMSVAQDSREFRVGDSDQSGVREVPLEPVEEDSASEEVSPPAASEDSDEDQDDDNFIPSEKINVDSEISFPVDI